MTLPNFLIIGAMKAGTTSLWHYLRRHPDVYLPTTKELHFFVHSRNWRKGLDWYESFFEAADDYRAIGEATPSYTRFEESPELIQRTLPEVKLIYVIRHPIERIQSHYRFARLVRKERRPIDRAVLRSPRYLDASRYSTWIERYLERFPRDRLLVLTSEELRDRRGPTLTKVFEFLSIDSAWVSDVTNIEFHRSDDAYRHNLFYAGISRIPGFEKVERWAPKPVSALETMRRRRAADFDIALSAQTRTRLEDELRDEVRRLRNYLGPDFDGWGIA